MQFTPAQQQAIEHTQGHLQLIACAGAGPTPICLCRSHTRPCGRICASPASTSSEATSAASVETQLLVFAAALEAATGERPGRLSIHDLASGRVQHVDDPGDADRRMRVGVADAARRLRSADLRPCLDAKRCESCDQRILCPGGRLPGVEKAA